MFAGFNEQGPQLYQVSSGGQYYSQKAKKVSNVETSLEKRFVLYFVFYLIMFYFGINIKF